MGFWSGEPKGNDNSHDILCAMDDGVAADAAALYGVKMKRTPRMESIIKYYAKGTEYVAKSRQHSKRYAARQEMMISHRFCRAGAIQLLLERGVFLQRFIVQGAVDDLNAAIASSWMTTWRNPKHAMKQVAFIRDAMQRLLDNEDADSSRVTHTKGTQKFRVVRRRNILVCPPRGWPDMQEVPAERSTRKIGKWAFANRRQLVKFKRPKDRFRTPKMKRVRRKQ